MQKKCRLVMTAAVLFFSLGSQPAGAQSDTPKVELGAHLAVIRWYDFDRTNAGFGGRITYNASDYFALEGEMNFFPEDEDRFLAPGRMTQGLFGLKTGMRSDTLGIFGKVRPGFARFNRVLRREPVCLRSILRFPPPPECFMEKTEFAIDLGGGFEFFPSRHSVVRFDVGNTLIRFAGQTTNNLQFNVGFGVRF